MHARAASTGVLAFQVGVSGCPKKASAASDRALPIKGLEKLNSLHGGLLLVSLAVQRGRDEPRLRSVHLHTSALHRRQ